MPGATDMIITAKKPRATRCFQVTGFADIVIETAGLPPRPGSLQVDPIIAPMDQSGDPQMP